MKITAIRPQSHARSLGPLEAISSQLTAVYGLPDSGKSSLNDLLAHVLYGKASSSEVRAWLEGSVEITSRQGNHTLARQQDGSPFGRLSISAANHGSADVQSAEELLAEISPKLLRRLYAIDFAANPRVEELLGSELTGRFFESALGATPSQRTCRDHASSATATTVDRRLIDELVARRDELALQIEQQIGGRRQDSSTIERELTELDQALASKRTHEEELLAELRRLEGELAAIESRLRYFSMESTLRRGPHVDSAEHQARLAELDAEISRCRTTLSDLRSREATVRRDLATVHADGTADNAASLADQRVTLGVLEQVMNDLDAEVTLLARAHEPGRCIAPEAHTRITPVADLLRQQIYTLCGQLTEQERAARRRQLTAESRHLARSQTDLSEQLEHLLERRQELTHEAQLAGQPVMLLPQVPVEKHCQCEHHREFLGENEAMLLGSTQRGRFEQDWQAQRHDLGRRREDVSESLARVARERAELERRWEALQQERADLVVRTSVDTLRDELRRTEQQLQQAISRKETIQVRASGTWRASDVLAQLTDGRLNQVRLPRDGRQATIVSRSGQTRQTSELTAAETDQVYLAIALAMISDHAARDIQLPLLLDEPFLRLSDSEAAAMASVLDEFARQGHQVILFTADRNALERLQSLGVDIRRLGEQTKLKEVATPPKVTTPKTTPPKVTTTEETHRHIVRETIDLNSTASQEGPRLRVTGNWAAAEETQDICYLREDDLMTEFPVLGTDTKVKFAALKIVTVADLLNADADWVAEELSLGHVSGRTVRLWQSHMSLMCFVAGVSLDDAQVLSACGIDSPGDFYEADIDRLSAKINEFLETNRGQRYAALRRRYSVKSLSNWRRNARGNRQRWAGYASRWAGHRSRSAVQSSSRNSQRREQVSNQRSGSSAPRKQTRAVKAVKAVKELRFFLERSSNVEDAPSIGPKTAERLAEVGIRTVADLLNADAESTANEIDSSHIKADTIAAWQHQARLVCCIPELRGYGAQLLVGCGLTEPEQIAGASEEDLFRKIRSFSRSKAGQRILRDGKIPNRDKVAEWIDYATHMRPLEAA